MKRISAFVATALLLAPLVFVLQAQEQIKFEDVEYISGKDGFNKNIEGQLLITDTSLQFNDDDKVIFTIPLASVTKFTYNVETDPGGFMRRASRFSNKSEEFLYLTSETATGAEGLVFKVKKKTGPGIVAKIEFAAKKAKG